MTSRTDEPMSWRYQRDAEQTRHRLAGDLDELNNRLTPGQVFDEMLTYARGSSGTFFRALGNASRDNPIPSMLIAAGAMMFLSEKMGLNRYIAARSRDANAGPSHRTDIGQASARMSNAASDAIGSASSGVRNAADSVRSGASTAADFASDQASKVADSAKKSAEAVSDTMSAAAQQARMTAHDLRDQASDAGEKMKRGAQRLSDTVQDYSAGVADAAERARQETLRNARQAKDTVVSFVQEQPLVSAAIGLAVGAAIAAILPSTETEDELMGEKADAVKDAVGEVASDQFQRAKAAAGKVAEEATNAAQREGLGPSQAVDAAKDLGEKVKTVVSETTAAAQSEVRDFASNADKKK
jgi:ElaB/YqjD/DUF883 family membrane-anchored ribosome-binding protein